MRDSCQVLSVSTQVFPTLVEEVRAEKSLNDPIPSSELCNFGSLQPLASSLTKNPDCLENTGSVTKQVATGATGGQPSEYKHTVDKQDRQCFISCTCSVLRIHHSILHKTHKQFIDRLYICTISLLYTK